MLGKARRKGTRPSWIGDDAWVELQTYWKKTDFLVVSSQNKTNRASARGGAVHTTGRKAHIDVALQLVSNKILTNYYYYEDSLYLDSFTRILYWLLDYLIFVVTWTSKGSASRWVIFKNTQEEKWWMGWQSCCIYLCKFS